MMVFVLLQSRAMAASLELERVHVYSLN